MTGIERIQKAFSKPGIKLMTHVVGGYPDLAASENIVLAMAQNGADLIEIQLPFSDPSADGPAIVHANYGALAGGVKTQDVLAMIRRLREKTDVPLLVMSYLNPIVAYGEEKMITDLVSAGGDGFIVPDCPVEERESSFIQKCNDASLAFVPLVAPSTSPERMKELADASRSPFVYAVLRLGVTGRKTELGAEELNYLSSVKTHTGRSVAAGFGISDKSQIDALTGHADCAIIGSEITRRIGRAAEDEKDPAKEIASYMKGLRFLSASQW
jgi:tryptophan synthase alpha chain